MTEMQIFEYQNKQIRTVEKDGTTWWVLKDICDALNLSSPHKVAERLDEDERCGIELRTSGGLQNTTVINESGLYNVILRSDKPEAIPFRKWVTSEVLPAIRKHGAYMTPETLEAAILNPDTIIKIATALKEEKEKNQLLQMVNSNLKIENAIMTPKAEYFDDLVDRNLLTNFRETAKQLQVKERDFIKFLLEKKYLYRDKRAKLMPYAKHVEQGLFVIKECFNDKSSWSGTQTLVTPKGRETFRLLCIKK
ncbi:MAG: phage antirepressor KilAC domain-containing protein [Acutalibacteraceae bacterium]